MSSSDCDQLGIKNILIVIPSRWHAIASRIVALPADEPLADGPAVAGTRDFVVVRVTTKDGIDIGSGDVLIAAITFIIIFAMAARGVAGAVLIGIVVATIAAVAGPSCARTRR